MDNQFEIIKLSRKGVLSYTKNLTEKQYNHIPKGFKNNIAWNIGHVLVTQQLLTHRLSGIDCVIDAELIDKFGKGAKPQENYLISDIIAIKSQLISVVEQTQKLYKQGKFKTFKTYYTSVGYTLNNIEEAIAFNNFHEGMHLGIIMSLIKLV